MEKLYTVRESANYLSCHEMTVRKMISKRQIPFIRKKGLGIRLRKEDLDSWLEQDLYPASGWDSAADF